MPGARIVIRGIRDCEHLQDTARHEIGRIVGNEAVEPAVVLVVFGLVDDSPRIVSDRGLLDETTHRGNRLGVRRGGGIFRDKEGETVRHLEALCGSPGAFLAAQPASVLVGQTA